jgi:hypothetical protein
VPAAAPVEVERYGWIRVLCDDDATPARIRHVQGRLHDRGYYRGELSGRYDAATAAAVGQFQARSHIGHGGYLSLRTIEALEESQSGYVPGYGSGYATGYGSGYGEGYTGGDYQQGYSVQGGYGHARPPAPSPCARPCGYAPPPPVYYQPQPCCQTYVYPPVYQPPCCVAPPCCAAPQAYPGGYVQGYYARPPMPAYAAAQASAAAYAGGAYAHASASASTSVVQNGWFASGGRSRY